MSERIVYNLLQVFVVLAFAPLVEGVLSRLKENLQSKRGPSIYQPYRDIWKYLHKEEIVSEQSSWIFRTAPYVAFTAPIFVALLISVLTRYPLFFAFMGDMLGRACPRSRWLLCHPGRGRYGQSLRRYGSEPNSHGRPPRRTCLHRRLPDGFVRGGIDHPVHRSNPLGDADRQLLRALPHPLNDRISRC